MHLITVTPATRLLLGSQLVVTDDPFLPPRLRLQLRTNLDSGVILDLDVDSLRFLSASLRTLLATYQAADRPVRRLPSRPIPRPVPRRLPF